MKTAKKNLLTIFCACLCAIFALLGLAFVHATPIQASAADTYTTVSISGDKLSINCQHSEQHICLKIEGSDWKEADNNYEFKNNNNAKQRLLNLGTLNALNCTADNFTDFDPYFNFNQVPDVFAIKLATQTEFTFPKGTKFPSYAYISTGSGDVYELTQAVKFTRPTTDTNTWNVPEVIEEKAETIYVNATMTDHGASNAWWETQNNAYWLKISLEGKNILPKDGGAAYYVNDKPTQNGMDWASYIYINNVSVRSALTTNQANNEYKGNEFPMTLGVVYAPVLVHVESTVIDVKILQAYVNNAKSFTITLKAGFEWATSMGEVLAIKEDVTYGYENGEFKEMPKEIDVTAGVALSDWKTSGGEYQVTLSLDGKNLTPNDKTNIDTSGKYYVNDHATQNGMDWAEYIYVNGVSARSLMDENRNGTTNWIGGTYPMSVGGTFAPVAIYVQENSVQIRILQAYADEKASVRITVKSGISWHNTDNEILKTTADVTYSTLGGTFHKEDTQLTTVDVTNDVTMVETTSYRKAYNVTYLKISLGGKTLTPNDKTSIDTSGKYYANDHATQNGMDWARFIKINDATVRSIVAVNASNVNTTNEYKHNSLSPLVLGKVYAPISVYIEKNVVILQIMQEYAAFESFSVTLCKGIEWMNSDGEVIVTTEDVTYIYKNENFQNKESYTVTLLDGETPLDTIAVPKGKTITLQDYSQGNRKQLGWLINNELQPVAYEYTVTEDAQVQAVFVEFSMKAGASIRAIGNSGLRFTYQLGASSYETYTNYVTESGIILLPTDTLGGNAFEIANFAAGENIIVANSGKDKQALNGGAYEYILRLVQIHESNYARAFSARGYLKVTYADGSTAYIYTEYTQADNSRSIAGIAKLVKANVNGDGTYANMSDEAKENIDHYCGAAQGANEGSYTITVSEKSADAIKAAYTQALGLKEDQLQGKTDIVIQLPEGTIELAETLKFEGVRAPQNNLPIRFVGNNTTISGGKDYKGGWTEYQNGIYKLTLSENYSAVRQLYVNGQPATLARTKLINANKSGTTFTISGVSATGTMEISTFEKWAQCYAVGECNNSKFTPNDATSYVYSSNQSYAISNPQVFLQNNLGLLDEANEFYYDASNRTLYYMPADTSKINELTFTVPVVETLLFTQGLVNDVVFENLTFAYSSFNTPAKIGYLETQAGLYMPTANSYDMLPGAVKVDSHGLRIENCQIKNTGASGITVERGAKDFTLMNSKFSNIAGSAVRVGDGYDWGGTSPLPTNTRIANNVVQTFGTVFGGAPGIMVGYADTVKVVQNTISDGAYSGISAGWGWTNNKNEKHKNYDISYNKITNVMNSALHDGGGIYVMGTFLQETSNRIAYNYVEVSNECISAIYLDEGASYYTIEHNVMVLNCKTTENAAIFLHNNVKSTNKGNGMRSITIQNNYYSTTVSSNKGCEYKYALNGSASIVGNYEYEKELNYSNATIDWNVTECTKIQNNSGANMTEVQQ